MLKEAAVSFLVSPESKDKETGLLEWLWGPGLDWPCTLHEGTLDGEYTCSGSCQTKGKCGLSYRPPRSVLQNEEFRGGADSGNAW